MERINAAAYDDDDDDGNEDDAECLRAIVLGE